MAKLRVFKTIENEVYTIVFVNDPDALSDGDKTLMQEFGEPEIDLGGTFGTSPNQFTLPSNLVRIRSDFPQTVTFDSRDAAFSSNTLTKVNSYITAITTSFTTAFTNLRTNTDTFSGETVTNI